MEKAEITQNQEVKEDLLTAKVEEPVAEDAVELVEEVAVPASAGGVFRESVVSINRVAKVVSGGKRLAFSAIMVIGDGNGQVGFGKGKAKDVQMAIAKASYQAKKRLIHVSLKGTTIAFRVEGVFGASRVLLRPAAPGTGVIAGGAIRTILEACGIRYILSKSLGSPNIHNVIYATCDALKQLTTKEEIAKRRGRKVQDL